MADLLRSWVRETAQQRIVDEALPFGNYEGLVAALRGGADGSQECGARVSAICFGLAAAFRDMGEYTKSLSYFELCLELRRHATDALGMAQALERIGVVQSDLVAYDRSRAATAEALAIAERESPEAPMVTRCLVMLGQTALNLGDLAAAKEHFEQCLAIQEARTEEGNSERSIARTLVGLGQVAQKSNDLTTSKVSHILHETTRHFTSHGKQNLSTCTPSY